MLQATDFWSLGYIELLPFFPLKLFREDQTWDLASIRYSIYPLGSNLMDRNLKFLVVEPVFHHFLYLLYLEPALENF